MVVTEKQRKEQTIGSRIVGLSQTEKLARQLLYDPYTADERKITGLFVQYLSEQHFLKHDSVNTKRSNE